MGDELTGYADDALITELLGNAPKTKMLAVFLAEHERDMEIKTVADYAGLSKSAVYDHINDLQRLGVVQRTRAVAGSDMYRLDKEKPIARARAELEWTLVDQYDDGQNEDYRPGDRPRRVR